MDHTAKFASKAISTTLVNSSTSPVESTSLWDLMQIFITACGFYAKKLVQPLPLNYAIMNVHPGYLYLGILLFVLLACLLWRRRPVGTFILLSAGIASSALFVIFSGLAWAPVAERYMYVPSGIFVAAMSIGMHSVIERFRLQNLAGIAASLLLFAAGWATAQRNIVWQDNLTLYQDTVKKSPDSALARNELALALLAKGRTGEAESIINSIRVPSNQRSSLNKAAVLADQGEYQAARDLLLERLEKPGKLEARILEMLIKITHEMIDETDDESLKKTYLEETLVWLKHLDTMSGDPFINYRIGRVQMWLDNIPEAQKNFAIAAKSLPDESPFKAAAKKLALKLAK
jgi:tetratricopeptide (TPR) repeat protein